MGGGKGRNGGEGKKWEMGNVQCPPALNR